MSIELTAEQVLAVSDEDEVIVCFDPWTTEECGILAGIAFGKLDDTDYSEYLENS